MNDAADRWIQRMALAALVALAATLVSVGVLFYASPSRAQQQAPAAEVFRLP
jgi:hypothetical protein